MKYLFLVVILLQSNLILAQKHDYVWITGDDNQTIDTTHGGISIDFNLTPPNAYYNYRKLDMFVCNASICDTSGQLIAYTNGCAIAGANDEILENGDNLNPGLAHQVSCIQNDDGYASGTQSAIFLPLPGSDSVYYLFHKQMKLNLNPIVAFSDNLLLSIIDRTEDKNGKVVLKNHTIIHDTLAYGELVAVKHANGQDWWIVTPRRVSNTFYILRLTSVGIVDTGIQTIGISPELSGEGYGQMVFSPNGTKMYRTNPYNPVMVYTFDRENGVFTSFDTISFDYGFQNPAEIGCAVSPGGRYLYLSCKRYLYQLDLEAADISASQITVAEWDGYAAPLPTIFWQCQLGPDCKIYIMSGDTRSYHVIHAPDEPGLSCDVELRGLPLPTPAGASMPSFPNYRLGPSDAPGLPCTPTVSAGPGLLPQPQVVRVYPNPASEVLYITLAEPAGQDLHFQLLSATGMVLRNRILSGGEGQYMLDVSALPPGIYWYRVMSAEVMVQVGKVVISK